MACFYISLTIVTCFIHFSLHRVSAGNLEVVGIDLRGLGDGDGFGNGLAVLRVDDLLQCDALPYVVVLGGGAIDHALLAGNGGGAFSFQG